MAESGGIPGDPDQLRAMATVLVDQGEQVSSRADDVTSACSTATAGWSGSACSAFQGSMNTLSGAVERTGATVADAGPILERYAAELEKAKKQYADAEAAFDEAKSDYANAEGKDKSAEREAAGRDAMAASELMASAKARALAANEAAADGISALTGTLGSQGETAAKAAPAAMSTSEKVGAVSSLLSVPKMVQDAAISYAVEKDPKSAAAAKWATRPLGVGMTALGFAQDYTENREDGWTRDDAAREAAVHQGWLAGAGAVAGAATPYVVGAGAAAVGVATAPAWVTIGAGIVVGGAVVFGADKLYDAVGARDNLRDADRNFTSGEPGATTPYGAPYASSPSETPPEAEAGTSSPEAAPSSAPVHDSPPRPESRYSGSYVVP